MSQDHKNTAADFERYHSGKMSAQEMHAIEKAALEDPFLADALEGYVNTPTPVKDVADLKEKLFAKRRKKNVFFLMSKQNAWTRIAAIFILIVGIGYLTYQLRPGREDNVIAIKQDSISIKDIKQQPVTTPDSLINEKEGLAITTPDIKSKAIERKENNLPGPDQPVLQDVAESAGYERDQALQQSPLSPLQKNSREMNVLRGRVVDSLGNPIRYAAIRDKDKKVATSSDSTGRFMLVANDSSLTAVVSAVGFKTKEKKLSDKEESIIVIEPANQSLNEVVVTASGIRKSEKALGYESVLQGKVPGVDVTTSQPNHGWQKFTEYVQKNINIPADTSGKNYKGTVILSFETNKKGTPKKIKVVQSLCAACDKEAIRLLVQGPKWTPSNNRQVVPIQF